MKTLAKISILISLLMFLSGCATSNRYGGYSGDDGYYSSGYNYPSSGGYYPQPGYPYGNNRNYPYNQPYQRVPVYPGNPGYGYNQPYYNGYPNNYNYYRNQPRPIPAPPGFYRNQPRPIQTPPGFYRHRQPEQVHHHQQNNYYYGRPPYNQGRWQGGNQPQPNPPAVGRFNRWQNQQPNYNTGNQGNWAGRGNWQRPQQGNNFNRPAGGGNGQWQQQNRPQVRIQNNGGNVNFGRMSTQMRQQPMNQSQNRAYWERRRRAMGND